MNTKNGSFVAIFNKNRTEIFLVRRNDYCAWVLTGGGIEKRESPKEAAVREAFEESGFKVRIIRALGKYLVTDKSGYKLRDVFLFEGRIVSGEFVPEIPGCLGKWFPIGKLPRDSVKSQKDKMVDAINFTKSFKKRIVEDTHLDNVHLLFLHPIETIKYIINHKFVL